MGASSLIKLSGAAAFSVLVAACSGHSAATSHQRQSATEPATVVAATTLPVLSGQTMVALSGKRSNVPGEAAWSPDHRSIVFVTPNANHLDIKPVGGSAHQIYTANTASGVGLVQWPLWAPNGQSVAVVANRGSLADLSNSRSQAVLVVIDLPKLHLHTYPLPRGLVDLPYPTTPLDGFAWSPDSSKILISWKGAAVIDLATGAVSTISQTPIVAGWGPHSDSIYYLGIHQTMFDSGHPAVTGLYVRRPASKTASLLLSAAALRRAGLSLQRGPEYGSVRLSPDGTKLAIATGTATLGTTILVYGFRDDRLQTAHPIVTSHTSSLVWELSWAPDNRNIAAFTSNGKTPTISAFDTAHRSWHTLTNLPFINALDPNTIDALGTVQKLSWAN
jgi:Tol biopolymer transport system component